MLMVCQLFLFHTLCLSLFSDAVLIFPCLMTVSISRTIFVQCDFHVRMDDIIEAFVRAFPLSCCHIFAFMVFCL